MNRVTKKPKEARDKKASNRPSIYPNKKFRLQGVISAEGARCFKVARKCLANTSGWKSRVSDADTIEFLARQFVEFLAHKFGVGAKQ